MLRGVGEDKICWMPAKKRGFEVSSYYEVLIGSGDQSFPWKSIQKSKVPFKVALFVWIAALGKILTIDNLRLLKIWILDWCFMCKSNGELVDHLLIHCSIAMELWAMVFSLFGIHWVMPKMVVDLLACWQGNFGQHRNGVIWIWCIWQKRTGVLRILKGQFLILKSSASKPYWIGWL